MSESAIGWYYDIARNVWIRKDRLVIVEPHFNDFVIKDKDEKTLYHLCPCCEKPFATARAARVVADHMVPVTS